MADYLEKNRLKLEESINLARPAKTHYRHFRSKTCPMLLLLYLIVTMINHSLERWANCVGREAETVVTEIEREHPQLKVNILQEHLLLLYFS